MRIPAVLMPQMVDIRAFKVQTPSGPTSEDWKTVRASVDDTEVLIKTASGEEVVSTSVVMVDQENFAADGSEVIVWKGTPRERTWKVVKATYGDDPYCPYALLRVG